MNSALRLYSYSAAVKRVGAALRDQRDLRAGAASRVGVRITRGNAELLNRVLGHTQHAVERVAVVLVIYVDAIERDV